MVFSLLICSSYGLLGGFELDAMWLLIGLGIDIDFYGKLMVIV